MKSSLSKNVRKLLERHRITDGKKFRLEDFDPGDTGWFSPKSRNGRDEAEAILQDGVKRLEELQGKLYAQDRWGVLAVLQGMDASGKDGAIKHVMSGVNPQGVQVTAFKVPSAEELDHDYLWRMARSLPERGRIGIFNRSHYEEVLVVRVHPAILAGERVPPELLGKDVWSRRYEDINAFERYLARNGYLILKFFLHLSKKEQKRRFLERLDMPEKNWKFSLGDLRERESWSEYQRAYAEAIAATGTPWAPWYVVPADHKWFARMVVVSALVSEMEKLGLAYPKLDAAKRKELAEARKKLR